MYGENNQLHPAHDDIVDWNVNQLDKKTYKAHDEKPNPSGSCNFRELLKNN